MSGQVNFGGFSNEQAKELNAYDIRTKTVNKHYGPNLGKRIGRKSKTN